MVQAVVDHSAEGFSRGSPPAEASKGESSDNFPNIDYFVPMESSLYG